MNYTLIVLGIVVAILIYVLYLYFSDDSQEVTDYHDLSESAMIIQQNDLKNQNSARYAYGIWVYVNSWNSTGEKVIFTRGSNAPANSLKVSLNEQTPTLKVTLYDTGAEPHEVFVTNNFPIQKWVYLVVSVDGTLVDTYLDGKLVKSHQVTPNTGSTLAVPGGILTSDSQFNAYAARFKRWTHPINPQTVYDEYMKGNGQGSMIGAYGVDVSILKDNIEERKFSLL